MNANQLSYRELIQKLEIKHNRVCWYSYATDYMSDCLKTFVNHLMGIDWFYHIHKDYLHALDDRLEYE